MSKHKPYTQCPNCHAFSGANVEGHNCLMCWQGKMKLRLTETAEKARDEAFSILEETGLTPRELASQRKELLEALERLVNKFGVGPDGKPRDWTEYQQARAVIAKAKGEK